MTPGEEALRSLREALQFSPDNLPLRQYLAEMLLTTGQPDAAEQEYRQALAMAPEQVELKVGLAQAFYQQGKYNQASVVVEALLQQPDSPPVCHLLQARLLLNSGQVEAARRQYHQAVAQDPELADPDLAEQLGADPVIEPDPQPERVPVSWDLLPSDFELDDIERPAIDFRAVGGMEALKEEIRLKIIYPLTHQQLYQAYGKSVGGGLLLYGPPGCGKTHLARATAGEIQANFISVGINEILDMWLGNSERNLHEWFEQARFSQPCVLFFDEVDALAANRSDLRQSAGRQLINQFLAELDGIESDNEGVLILAATNAPWHLDPAFRRPGRFDRILFVPPPDAAARAEILRIHCEGKPVKELNFRQLSRRLEHFSGADLKAVVDVAVEQKLQSAMKVGYPQPLTTRDLLQAAKMIKPSTREWFATARNYALYANQGGLYDDVLKYFKG